MPVRSKQRRHTLKKRRTRRTKRNTRKTRRTKRNKKGGWNPFRKEERWVPPPPTEKRQCVIKCEKKCLDRHKGPYFSSNSSNSSNNSSSSKNLNTHM